MRRYIAFIILQLLCLSTFAADEDSGPTKSILSGNVTLSSHYVENGISQSNNSPSLQGAFWFNFGPQFRLGLSGASTSYTASNDHFNLKLVAEIKVIISSSTNLILATGKNQFYSGGERNGNLSGVYFNTGDYRFSNTRITNWEATGESMNRWGFGKTSTTSTGLKWNNEVGYNTSKVSNVHDYFDLRSGLGKMYDKIFLEGAVSFTSNGSDLLGKGDPFIILSARVDL